MNFSIVRYLAKNYIEDTTYLGYELFVIEDYNKRFLGEFNSLEKAKEFATKYAEAYEVFNFEV